MNRHNLVGVIRREERWSSAARCSLSLSLVSRFVSRSSTPQRFTPASFSACFPLHSFLTCCSPSISISLIFIKLPKLVSCAQQVCVPVCYQQPRLQAVGGSVHALGFLIVLLGSEEDCSCRYSQNQN